MKFSIKRSHKRTTSWNIFFHYSTILYGIITGIILVPLYLKYIPRDVYGLWLATGNILAWLTLIDPGFSAVLQQRTAFHYGASNFKAVGQYAFGGIIINLGFVVIIALLGVVFSFNFTHWLNITDPTIAIVLKRAFNFTLIGTLLMIFSYIIVSINQGLQSSLGIGLIYAFANVSGIVLTIVLLHNGWGVIALGASLLWRAIIFVVGNVIYLSWRFKTEKLQFSFESSVIKDFTGLSLYNFLGKIGSTLNTQLNSFVSAKMLTPIDTTILKFTQSVPETSKLLLVRASVALIPSISHLSGQESIEKIQAVLLRFLNYLIWGGGLAFMGFIIFNKPFITLWVGSSFYGGTTLNIMVVSLLFITIFTNSFSGFAFALGNIKQNSIMQFIQSLLFVPLMLLGTHYWGLKGMLLSAIIAELSISGWYYPMIFFRKIKVELVIIKYAFFELCKVLLISFLLIFIIKCNVSNWLFFAIEVLGTFILYIAILLILSRSFRSELMNTFNTLKCRLIQK